MSACLAFTGIQFPVIANAETDAADIRRIPLVDDFTATDILSVSRGKDLVYNANETFVDIFLRFAAVQPDRLAVADKDSSLTYRELDDLTDNIAAYLINRYHVQPEEAVGVMTDRSELMAVYPLAIMKAGAAYMPLDFTFPEERLRYMCEDAEVRLILSEGLRVRHAMPSFNGDVFTSDALETLSKCSSPLPDPLSSHRYVILYTSGSTGRPKGVALEYHNIVN